MPNASTDATPPVQLSLFPEFTSRPIVRPGPKPGQFLVDLGRPVLTPPECSVRHAMARLGYSKRTIHRLILQGHLEAHRPPGRRRYRINRASLDRLAAM